MAKLAALKMYFGHDAFRPGQEPLIDALLQGRNALGGMLTGGVKYFVTALLCIFALSILCVIAKGLYNDRQAKKAAGEKKNG